MFYHKTVLQHELVSGVITPYTKIAVDCTAGGGGHTKELLDLIAANDKFVIAIDRDTIACEHLKLKFQNEIKSSKLIVVNQPFSELRGIISELNLIGKIDAIIADLGVSSPQLDNPERGFSFNNDGPLDMRMDSSLSITASDVVNSFGEKEIADILWQYGEDPKSRFIAKRICEYRTQSKFTSTVQLANLIAKSKHNNKKPQRKHPATQAFQALRIYVNRELDELNTLLISGIECLSESGRLGIISFHSLEDRMVKKYFKKISSSSNTIPNDVPLTAIELAKYENITCKIVHPFPIEPSQIEIEENPRSRSAKLRIIQKITAP